MTGGDLKILQKLTLKDVEDSITRYSSHTELGLVSSMTFSVEHARRLVRNETQPLLNIVRGQRVEHEQTRSMRPHNPARQDRSNLKDQLKEFWTKVDGLPSISLRDLPNTGSVIIRSLISSIEDIRGLLRNGIHPRHRMLFDQGHSYVQLGAISCF